MIKRIKDFFITLSFKSKYRKLTKKQLFDLQILYPWFDMERVNDEKYWDYISLFQKLSEDFIREFKDRVNWIYISYYQTLSEYFIREFKDKVDWIMISHCQDLSEDFIREFFK